MFAKAIPRKPDNNRARAMGGCWEALERQGAPTELMGCHHTCGTCTVIYCRETGRGCDGLAGVLAMSPSGRDREQREAADPLLLTEL